MITVKEESFMSSAVKQTHMYLIIQVETFNDNLSEWKYL